ncbi:MAG TPA: FtsW/RodA/SpoVE family cell cycle protein [Marmoricola sp.]|nr:FtsW/RodA/SpoVE family cell cycle protein [Marmoricola sp.]
MSSVDMANLTAGDEFTYRKRGVAEFALVLVSICIGVFSFAAVGFGLEGRVLSTFPTMTAWFAFVIIAAHVAIRRFAPYADPTILPIISALNGIGLAMIERLHHAQPHTAPSGAKQLMWTTVGVICFIAILAFMRDHRRLQGVTYTSAAAAVALLLLPLLPGIGTNINGARIWIHLGSFSFQPGEIAKILLVVSFAGYLVQHRDALALAGRRVLFVDLPRGRDLGPIVAMWAIGMAILVFQNDLGFPFVLFGLLLVLLYVSTERPGWLVVGGILATLGGVIAYLAVGHFRTRVQIWIDPFGHLHDPVHDSSQLVQGFYGMAWGGLTGRGWGQGQPWRTPFNYSDFMSASIGEELGLTGLIAILLLYVLFVERGLRTALISRDNLGKLLAIGLSTVVMLQVFAIVGGVLGLIPLTGLTTPFLSYGGSSLISNWAVAALLVRISDQARRPLPRWNADDDVDATAVVVLR